MRGRGHWRSALGILLSAGFLAWTLHGVDLRLVGQNLRHANLLLFAAMMVTATLTFPLRARRWRTILDPIAPHLPFAPLWHGTTIGAMANNIAPARAGEFARAYTISRETRVVRFSAAFASLAVDRVFDALVVLLLTLGAMIDPAFPRDGVIGTLSLTRWAATGSVLVAIGFGVLYVIVFFPAWMITVYEWFARRLAPRFEERGRAFLHSFASGLGVLRHPLRFAAVMGWTVAHWLVNAASFWIGFRAVGITAPFSAALLVQGFIAIAVIVPSAPGFFGLFEYFGKVGLGVYGVNAALATSWAIGYHVLTFIPITLIGLYDLARLGLHVSDLREAREADSAA